MATKTKLKKSSMMTQMEAITIAKWMLENDASCREAATHFRYEKTAINDNLHKFDLGNPLNRKIKTMFKRHKTAAYLKVKGSARCTSKAI